MLRLPILFCFSMLLLGGPLAAAEEQPSAIEDFVDGLLELPGFYTLYWDAPEGRLYLQIDRFGEELIYQTALARGVGSNDLGLDRGQLGATRLVTFFPAGNKVLMLEKNLAFRAASGSAGEASAVESSFAQSAIWGFEVTARHADSVLVDATDFFLRDAHGMGSWLGRAQQGQYAVDPSRSAIYLPRTKAFPDNTEVEAIVTFVGDQQTDAEGNAASDLLATVVPDHTSVTVHLHHSLIRLPEGGYQPLPFDPRSGMISDFGNGGFLDYSSEIGKPLKVLYAWRHRLSRKDPQAEISEAVEPIVYYVDHAAPEPIRSALVEGAQWWNQAFEAAGYKDAFQVRILPEDVDPMDVRYNVIQWVHRATRGWSYGSSVLDPRTGEILKGHVTLGSLRVRQDYLIAEGLLSPYTGDAVPDTMLEMALARIRQLSAHEVGHTLGLEHNFAASADDRASVMDYPFPLVRFAEDGSLDLSDAYGVGIGPWDARTISYAYRDFPAGVDQNAARQAILQETIASGLHFVADEDARDPSSAHPLGNLWDNGADAIEELDHLMKVRAYALQRMSENTIREGQPMASLEEVLVPIYLFHRYQIEAVGKLLGGSWFNYTLRGDGQPGQQVVEADRQRQALRALLATLDPEHLLLPPSLTDRIPPRPPGHALGRETFARTTGTLFDPLAPAASAVSLTLNVLLSAPRAARMNTFHAANRTMPGFSVVLNALFDATWYADPAHDMAGSIQRNTSQLVLQKVMAMAHDMTATAQVRGQALAAILALDAWLAKQRPGKVDVELAAHQALARHAIRRMLNDPAWVPTAPAIIPPPGSPIGN